MSVFRALQLLPFLWAFLQASESLCLQKDAKACYTYALPLVSGENAKVQDLREKGLAFMRKSCLLGYMKACDVIGENYYKDKSYRAALPYLEQSCARSVVFACEAAGVIYRDGRDVRQSDHKAREYFEKACKLGSGDACYNIAMMYRGGFGVEKSRSNEKKYYQLSCEKGLRAGCEKFTELDNEDRGIDTGIIARIKAWFQ